MLWQMKKQPLYNRQNSNRNSKDHSKQQITVEIPWKLKSINKKVLDNLSAKDNLHTMYSHKYLC